MENVSPRVRALLRQAQRTEESGKRAAAEQLYRQIVEEEPETVAAWLGLARVSGDLSERDGALRRVLNLDPDNRAARDLLEAGGELAERDSDSNGKGLQQGADGDEDPFAQSRSWLDEATARRLQQAPEASTTAGGGRRQTVPDGAQPARQARSQSDHTVAPAGDAAVADSDAVLYCYRHPQRETGLRCITCNRPICTKCAKHTPVGYRCPQCIREAQDVFFSANVLDYMVTGVVTLILAVIAGLIAPRLGFFVIFIGPAAGTLIGRIAFRVGRRRHGRYLPHLVAALVAIGGLLPTGLPLAVALLAGAASLGSLGFGLLWPLIYVFLATGAAYYQVK